MAENSDSQSPVSDFPSDSQLKLPQVPTFPYFPSLQNGDVNMLQVMYPALVPGVMSGQYLDRMNSGPGIYAVPVLSSMGRVTRIPTNSLIPLAYTTPMGTTSSNAVSGAGEQSLEHQQPPPQRPVGRRFQIALHLDLFLIFKLVAVILIFNHDGSNQRLALLVFLASIVYLYQTGALTPLMRWVSQAMHRAAAPPRPPRPAARAEPILREGNEAVLAAPDGQPGADNENRHEVAENQAAPEGGNQWWGIVKEIQMIVFGFITSLLPGFHNIDQP